LRENGLPPATDRKAAPATPLKNRETNIVSIFFATAHGTIQIVKMARDKM